MAILLGAFLIQGSCPARTWCTSTSSLTYSMVWTVSPLPIFSARGFATPSVRQFARFATLRYTLILPLVLSVVYIGAFEASRSWGDLITLLLFGVFGWLMKQFKWPRPPLVLGLAPGDLDPALHVHLHRALRLHLRPRAAGALAGAR